MKRASLKLAKIFCGAILMCFVGIAAAQAGTVHGTVKNGTTGKPAPGVAVMLIQLQGGMQPVANTQSDAQGQFTFDNPGLGAQPMLVRAVYRGINFHQPVPPGKSDVEVAVYEPTKDPKAIAVTTRVVFFQPNGTTLIVGEEYSLQNDTKPPEAFFRADGNFEFSIPENAQLQQVAASGPAGMPVVQAPIDKTKGQFAIAYAFRPGENTVRYSYEIPYPNNTASVKIPASTYAARRLLIVAPPSVQIAGEGLQPGGQEQGMAIYGRENLAANTTLAVNIAGTAPPPGANGGADQGQSGQEAQGAGASTNIQQVPGRLDVLKWPLVAGFIGIFAVGAILLVRKPVAVTVASVENSAEAVTTSDSQQRSKSSNKDPAPASQGDTSTLSMENVNAAVASSLEYLKDQLFRLELRHQAGTIPDDEYAAERARAEKVLRDLVRG
ncbi:MAG TPA: carboxypeptidase-like regulatory domain-containing protein [Verrucomicrobiae bacterium]|nr:carboxypeptidase-like regulatory domain-containing protein [Verrucomicrobiae bacterium]